MVGFDDSVHVADRDVGEDSVRSADVGACAFDCVACDDVRSVRMVVGEDL